jgi:2-dehydropantoate 2-reductase
VATTRRMEASPTIAIVGAGALGGYLGALLAHAGHRVRFLVRSDLALLRQRGWTVEGTESPSFHLERPEVFDRPEEIGPVGLVLVALKTTQHAALEALLPPLVGPGTVLFTVQNGLGNVERLAALFPARPILAGLCQIGVNRVSPGRLVSYVPGGGFVQVGAGPHAGAGLVHALATLLEGAGIKTRELPTLGEALWRKLMWNVPYNGLTVAAGGVATDAIVGDPHLNAVSAGLMEELRQAAGALGFPIEETYVEKLIGFTARLGTYRPSSLIDWEAGRPLEVEAIWGEPLRQGRAVGVAMPHLATLHALLAALDRRRSAAPPAGGS